MNDGCETAIARTGWGLCHYFIVGICGFCSLAEASALLIVFVVTPLLACDLKFTRDNVLTMNAILSLGMAFGGLLFGTLVDHNGRKGFIPVTMIMIFCSSMCLSFAQRIFPISMAIFFLGTGVAGNNVTLRVYLIECLPAKRRGTCLALLDLLWVLGYLSSFAIAWSLVPSVVRMFSNEFRPSSWRVLAGLGGAPSLLTACVAGLLPSSPRYLLYRRNLEQALAVLQQTYAINNSRHADHFPFTELEGCIRPDENEDTGARNAIKAVEKYGAKTWKKIQTIFRPPYKNITILSMISRMILFPGFVWLAMWKAHVSYRGNDLLRKPRILTNPHDSTICVVDAGDVTQSFLHDCQVANHSLFEYSLLLSTSYIVGEGLVFFGIDLVGRRLSLVISGMIGGTSILALVFANRYAAQIVLSIFFLAAYSIVYTTTGISTLENYPTSVRGTVFGLTSVLPHLTAFFVKFFVRAYCTRSLYVATGLIIGTTLAAIPIPDLTRVPMRE